MRIQSSRALLAIAAGALAIAAGCGIGEESRTFDLTDAGARAPYRLEPSNIIDIGELAHVHQPPPTAFADLDGDGLDDMVQIVPHGVLARTKPGRDWQTLWNHVFDLGVLGRGFGGGIVADYDVDRDGRNDVVVMAQSADRSRNLVLVLDPHDGMELGSIILPGGPDHHADGVWDGGYIPLGMVETAGGAALVLVCGAEYDAEPRGVVAVDPIASKILWRFDCGPSVGGLHLAPWIGDLEGDGHDDIVVGGKGTNNVSDHPMVFPDDHSAVYVLDEEGRLRWERRLGGPNTGVQFTVADLDGDSSYEVVTAMNQWTARGHEITVWSHDGRRLARLNVPSQTKGLASISGSRGGRDILRIHTAGLATYTFSGSALAEQNRLDAREPLALTPIADPVDADRFMILASTDQGLRVLSPGGDPVASGTEAVDGEIGAWYEDPSLGRILAVWWLGGSEVFRLDPVTRGTTWPAILGGVLVVAVTAAAIGAVRRRRARRPTDPTLRSATHQRLLDLLQRDRHQRMPAVYRLSLLIQRLEHRGADMDRIRESVGEFLQNGLGHLQDVVQAASSSPSAIPGQDLVATALPRIASGLEASIAAGVDDDRRRNAIMALRRAHQQLESGVDAIWQHLVESFEADLGLVLRAVLRQHESDLVAAGVHVEGPNHAGSTPLLVHCDPAELEYAIENLVRNAIRSMESSEEKRLALRIEVDDDRVILDVADTGCGVPRDRREAIWTAGAATEPGHARGLPRSRGMIARFGGTLRLLTSQPGSGSVFRLALLRGVALKRN